MSETKELVEQFVDRMERRDWPGFAKLLAAELIYEVPQTRERIIGRERYVTFNAEFPGDWHIEPEVILTDDHDACVRFAWTQHGETSTGIAFFEVDAGVITKVTDFWPHPYEPPPGREHLVERY